MPLPLIMTPPKKKQTKNQQNRHVATHIQCFSGYGFDSLRKLWSCESS